MWRIWQFWLWKAVVRNIGTCCFKLNKWIQIVGNNPTASVQGIVFMSWKLTKLYLIFSQKLINQCFFREITYNLPSYFPQIVLNNLKFWGKHQEAVDLYKHFSLCISFFHIKMDFDSLSITKICFQQFLKIRVLKVKK